MGNPAQLFQELWLALGLDALCAECQTVGARDADQGCAANAQGLDGLGHLLVGRKLEMNLVVRQTRLVDDPDLAIKPLYRFHVRSDSVPMNALPFRHSV